MQLTSSLAYLLYAASVVLAAPVEKRAGTSYSGSDEANDLSNGVCAPVSFIFARGSTESGNMGSTVGPALAKQLISLLGNSGIAIQGVDYPATIESNISEGSEGGPTMASLANKALSSCPDTKIVLSGYSQGATVTHYAIQQGGLDASKVTAVVLYGDPEDGTALGSLPSSKLKDFCASGDGVCETHTFDITAAHLSYTTNGDIQTGAQFVVGLTGTSTGSSSTTSGSSTASSSAASSSDSSSLGSLSSLGSFGGFKRTPTAQFSGLPSGLGGLGSSGSALPSDISGLGSLASALPSGIGGLGSLGSLGSSGSSGLSGLGGTSSSSGIDALPSLSTGSLGSLSGLGSSGESGLSGLSEGTA